MAMKEKSCVAIAADRRFGIQAQMVTTDFQKIFSMDDRLCIHLARLITDIQTVVQCLKFRLNLCELKEDLTGCPMVTDDFMVSGTCAEQMYEMFESLWESNMDPEHLFEIIFQAMRNAVDQNAVSGMGVIVHITEKDKITTRTLKALMD
ncbi:hypothetical protein H8959_014684 [Pygathrix nigripes]